MRLVLRELGWEPGAERIMPVLLGEGRVRTPLVLRVPGFWMVMVVVVEVVVLLLALVLPTVMLFPSVA